MTFNQISNVLTVIASIFVPICTVAITWLGVKANNQDKHIKELSEQLGECNQVKTILSQNADRYRENFDNLKERYEASTKRLGEELGYMHQREVELMRLITARDAKDLLSK